MTQHVVVIGLDCAAPDLVFQQFRSGLPTLSRFMERGVWGEMESTIPPITVPAWMCMMTGRDPGELGVYGFRNRRDHSYDGLTFASSRMIDAPALWDILGAGGLQTITLGTPLTYPVRPIEGLMVSGFLAPDTQSNFTWPPSLRDEILGVAPDYALDVRDFRTNDKDRLLSDVIAMTRSRFRVGRHLLEHHPWNLFVMVEIGLDRMHHGFWRFHDPEHRAFEPGNALQHAIRDYYRLLDGEIRELIDGLPSDTLVLVVSDHGAKRLEGGLCFNDWLIAEDYLVLKSAPVCPTRFDPELVDWSRTRAWGDGGYYGRLFLNIAGREPAGIVPPEDVEALKNELTAKLERLTDEHGAPLGSQVFQPHATYRTVKGVAPDLIVYFGDLSWRSIGSVGNRSIWTHDNDTGPDDANHAQQGIFMMAERGALLEQRSGTTTTQPERKDISIYDVAPTVLAALGVAAPAGVGRHAVAQSDGGASAYTAEEEAELARRLSDLGYL
ncbi:MAG: alkaline phosphatase family protein [Armatimonadetes bacterium]|nr:alkaline phosphatase family protein [Armatimonadota bacterium]MDE2207808.1 alkaline phosphatase family protein [Armatimonadota bacterium]